jgi:hypothetical protein
LFQKKKREVNPSQNMAMLVMVMVDEVPVAAAVAEEAAANAEEAAAVLIAKTRACTRCIIPLK